MSQITMKDLNFWFETAVPNAGQLIGGVSYLADYATSRYTDHSSGYSATYTVSKDGYVATVDGQVGGVAAGAIAAAIAVGNPIIGVSTNAGGGVR
ncbi:MAG: hypothetical protein ACKO24_04960 [Leptolyngbyaceae cyanobacterium]